MKWYIGQRIVAIKDHPKGHYKKGDEFTIKGLRCVACNCGYTEINVGLSCQKKFQNCGICKTAWPADKTLWHREHRFAPLQSRPELSETTVNELGEIETKELQAA